MSGENAGRESQIPLQQRRRLTHFVTRSPAAAIGLIVLLAMLGTCYATLPWSSRVMSATNLAGVRQPPSSADWLGTDALGRSMLARTLYGGAISLTLGLVAMVVAVVIGTLYGATAGFASGRVDAVMMRAVDVLYALPYLLLAMLLTLSLGPWLERIPHFPAGRSGARLAVLALAVGGVSWLTLARVVRGQVLSLREQPFVEAARALGLSEARILLRHVLPNVTSPIIVFATLTVPQAILQESFLSFLGVGVQPPQATWGSLAAEGIAALNPIRVDWWIVIFPCAALALTLFSLNVIGDALRDALDVKRGARP